MRALLALFLMAAPAAAEAPRYLSSSGWMFTAMINANGAVLTSVQDMAIYSEAGAASTWTVAPVTIYLGLACDALSPELGEGSWRWANGGFVVEVGGRRFAFPRQDTPEIKNDFGCRM